MLFTPSAGYTETQHSFRAASAAILWRSCHLVSKLLWTAIQILIWNRFRLLWEVSICSLISDASITYVTISFVSFALWSSNVWWFLRYRFSNSSMCFMNTILIQHPRHWCLCKFDWSAVHYFCFGSTVKKGILSKWWLKSSHSHAAISLIRRAISKLPINCSHLRFFGRKNRVGQFK